MGAAGEIDCTKRREADSASEPVFTAYRKDVILEVARGLIGGALRPLIAQGGGGLFGKLISQLSASLMSLVLPPLMRVSCDATRKVLLHIDIQQRQRELGHEPKFRVE